MLNRQLHWNIVGRITGIVLLSALSTWLITNRISFFFSFVCICIIVTQAAMLIRKIEKIHHQLENFFNAIHNNDFNIHFTEKSNDELLINLYYEMNRIIKHFEDNQSHLEERRLYYESIIRVLTHEIRNSITPIASLSSDLVKHMDEYTTEEMTDSLTTIHQQAQQLSSFLHAYHRLTHLPDPVRTKVKIYTLFDKLSRLLNSEESSKHIHYNTPECMEILLDQNLITLALINLIHNALQVTTHNPDPYIEIKAGREVNFSFIQVTDNGESIPENRMEEIFTPFYSTKKEGSGIGLPLSQRIMQLHGGELILKSSTGNKTIFQMIFPEYKSHQTKSI